jgi:manganese transport protein
MGTRLRPTSRRLYWVQAEIVAAATDIAEVIGGALAWSLLFGVGLLASGLASASVGSYAGAVVMSGLLGVRVPLLVRRLVTMVPALLLLVVGVDPTWALIVSQVVLSFGISFALIPLIRLTSDRDLMGAHVNARWTTGLATAATGLIVVLNATLIVLVFR